MRQDQDFVDHRIKISNTRELQNTSGTRLLQCKGNPYRTFHVHSTKLGMESEFREEGESGKNRWSNHYFKYTTECLSVTEPENIEDKFEPKPALVLTFIAKHP